MSIDVMHLIREHDKESLFLSVVAFGELQKGINELSDKAWSERLQAWVDQDLTKRFEGRILPLDLDVLLT